MGFENLSLTILTQMSHYLIVLLQVGDFSSDFNGLLLTYPLS